MATAKKAAKKSATVKKAAASKTPKRGKVSTAAKKPYPENTGDNTKPPKSRPADAVDLLSDDHSAAGKIFKQFEKLMDKGGSAAEKKALADQVCGMLIVHTTLEEEIFYPAARAAGLDADMMDEAKIEHASAKLLIAQIKAGRPGQDQYEAKVKVLADYVQHHVVEEQTEMFPKCRRSTMDLIGLRKQMADRKAQLS
ncbi:MAG: hemerythrin domain-containing protein [Caldimonas sp.]